MVQTQTLNTVESSTLPLNVLFVTNQARIPLHIDKWLADNGIIWGKLGIEQFAQWSNKAEIIGTVIVDTTEITPSQKPRVLDVLGEFEKQNISTILLNDEINFPFDDFKLVTLLASASPEEFESKIEANIKYQMKPAEEIKLNEEIQNHLAKDRDNQLKLAGQVQKSFLPETLPDNDRLAWSAFFQPADHVSGDIYDVIRLDEWHIGFYIADAVGHSIPAALLTMFLKQSIVMRQTVGNDYKIFEPLEVIANLNKKMEMQHLPGCLFITCCYCLLNFETLELMYCRAGHPYPVLVKNAQNPQQLESRGGLLGVFKDGQFEQETIQLETGDKIFLYSDGVETLIGDCDDQSRFTFTEQFNSIANLPIEQMFTNFKALIKNRTIDIAEIDDATAVGLEIL